MGFNGRVYSGPGYDAPRRLGIARRERSRGRHRSRVRPAALNIDALLEARIAERTRIAQELHDTVLQGFCSVSMQLAAAIDHVPADSAAKLRLRDVARLVNRVLEEGRLAVMGLRSAHENFPSLSQAFAGVPNELGLPAAVRFRVVVDGRQRQLKAPLWEEIYRIGREAIINAYRHSRAAEIEMQIEYRPAELRVSVRDNGCGIDAAALESARSGHWGLLGMRERADRIGARLRVLSRIALGTEVELFVPGGVAFETGSAVCT